MAILTITFDEVERPPSVLALEIRYRVFQYGWVFYNFLPTLNGLPLLNEAGLKDSEDRSDTRVGSVEACEDEFCSLLPKMWRFLETGEDAEWSPYEPDVCLTIKRSRYIEHGTFDVNAADIRQSGVYLVLSIDHYRFRGVTKYGAPLINIEYDCSWGAFRQFYSELRAEFVRFRDESGIIAHNVARGFDRPEHDWF